MFWTVILLAICVYFINLIFKYIYKPYMRIRGFKNNEKVYILPFVPLIGAFYLA